MRFSRRSPFISAAAGVALLAVTVSAQGKHQTSSDSSTPAGHTTNSQDSSTADQTSTNAQTQSTSTPPPQTTSDSQSQSSSSSSSSAPSTASTPSITGPTSSSTGSSSAPVITGSSATNSGTQSPFPTLAGAYVSPSVPPTANAPFMRESNLPEGTVFIIVGAILGFLAMSVILWRGLVVWSLHRNIRRAAIQQNVSTAKSTFQTPPAPFYSYKDRESALSVGGPKPSRKGARPSTGTAPSNQSLFFSPTAGANGMGNVGNRGSTYLPAGYYAAGASQLGGGQGMAHPGSNNGGISLSNLGPSREGYAKTRSVGPSPPGSPYISAIPSSSSLNLSQAPGDQRAPSAYLDDLFDSEGSPPVPNHRRNPSGAARGSARF